MPEDRNSKEPQTVGDALTLARETQEKLRQAQEILRTLTDAGVRKPAVLGDLVEPTVTIRDTLKREIEVLNEVARKFGTEGD